MKRIQTLAVAIAFTLPLAAYAADPAPMNPGNMLDTGAMPGMPASMAQGEIRKVDKPARKLTIKHGTLPNLDMTARHMVYRVKDPAMLNQRKAGEKINFAAESFNGVLTVTNIETTK